MIRKLLLACGAAGVLAAPPACADEDDDSRLGDATAVAEAGDCEVELELERMRRRGSTIERGTAAELACGIGWRTELTLAYQRQRAGDERDEGLAFGVKTELVETAPGRIGWTVGAAAAAVRAPGTGWRRSEWAAAVEASVQPAEGWLAEFQFGVARDLLLRQHSTLWAVALEHALDARFELRAAVGGDDRSRPIAEVGLRWLFAEDAYLKLSLGARSGAERERLLGVALKVEF